MTTNDLIDALISTAHELPGRAAAAQGWAADHLWWVALLALAGALGFRTAQRLISRATLRDRLALELLPTTGFDPVLEDVLRFAKQIARAQRSVSRWALPARGTAMRVRLVSAGGPLSMRIEGPVRATTVLRHQGYPQCELRPVETEEDASAQPPIRLGPRALESDTPSLTKES
jgi:hypothetical protein